MTSVSDMSFAALRGLGYTGSMSDMWSSYLQDNGTVGSATVALTPAESDITFLAAVNHWTVSAPLTVSLPDLDVVGQFTVHITGYQDLSWPVGTTIIGENTTDEVWVHLIHDVDGTWKVLVPGGASDDTGWVPLITGLNVAGDISYTVGSEASWGSANWGPITTAGTDAFQIRIRRIGPKVRMEFAGVEAKAATPAGNIIGIPVGYRPAENGSFLVAKNAGVSPALVFHSTTTAVRCTASIASGDFLGRLNTTNGMVAIEWITDQDWPV